MLRLASSRIAQPSAASLRLASFSPRCFTTAADSPVVVSHDVLADGTPTGVVTVTLNTPKSLNALTVEMGNKFQQVIENLKQDESVRAVVLTGNGRAFSAGGDMKFLKDRMTTPPQRNAETMRCVEVEGSERL